MLHILDDMLVVQLCFILHVRWNIIFTMTKFFFNFQINLKLFTEEHKNNLSIKNTEVRQKLGHTYKQVCVLTSTSN